MTKYIFIFTILCAFLYSNAENNKEILLSDNQEKNDQVKIAQSKLNVDGEISVTGKRSIVYDRVKQMSREIQNLSGVFRGTKVVGVRHVGLGQIPKGTIRLTGLPKPVKVLDTREAPTLFSVLQKEEKSFLVIVNKDFLNNIKFTIYGDETLQRVLKDGTIMIDLEHGI